MAKYILKPTDVFEVELLKKDVEINTISGKVLIEAGNYLVTDPHGGQYGITPADLENQYILFEE